MRIDKYCIRIIFFTIILLLNLTVNIATAGPFFVTKYNNPSPGYLLMDPYDRKYFDLVDNSGYVFPLINKKLSNVDVLNVDYQPNGLLTYYNKEKSKYYGLNVKGEIVDSFYCIGTNYQTDPHFMTILPNGNQIMLASEARIINMKQYIPNGYDSAIVIGTVFQEIDTNRSVVFEWKSLDHIQVTDATSDIDLTLRRIDYIHTNAVAKDQNGDYIISCRHLDQLLKISKVDGSVIWKMGGTGSKSNEFSFIGDTVDSFWGFSHQHDIQVLPNGNFLLFDNGNLKPNPVSRAVEYRVNEQSRTVTKVWEYKSNPNVFSKFMGSVQRLQNGNTIIGWGGNVLLESSTKDTSLSVVEVRPDGTVDFELYFSRANSSFRAKRYLFNMYAVTKSVSSTGSYDFNDSANRTGIKLTLSSIAGNGKLTVEKHFYKPSNLNFNIQPCLVYNHRWVFNRLNISSITGKIKISILDLPEIERNYILTIFKRDREGTGQFTRLDTKFDESNGIIEADFSGFGEFILASIGTRLPATYNPVNGAKNLPINGEIRIEKLDPQIKVSFQLSKSADFSNNLLEFGPDTLSNISYFGLDYNTRYYWRVSSGDSSCSSGWSEPRYFTTTLKTPDPNFPDYGAYDIPTDGEVKWSKIDGSNLYKVELALDSAFSAGLKSYNTKSNSVQYSGLNNNKQYLWRVKAINDSAESNWSQLMTFTSRLAAPQLIMPADSARAYPAKGIFNWHKVDGAEIYKVQVSPEIEFKTLALNENGIQDTLYNYTGLANHTGYFIRVQSIDAFSKSAWSGIRFFETSVAAPALDKPANNSLKIALNPVLRWKDVLAAKTYEIKIATDDSFSNIISGQSKLNTNFFNTDSLEYNRIYYWKVRAYDEYGPGDWSQVWNFTTLSQGFLASPELIEPANDSINLSLSGKLIWQMVDQAKFYRFQISENETFDSLKTDITGIAKATADYKDLAYFKKYYWHVLAYNDQNTSDWSPVYSFYTALKSPDPQYPLNNSTGLDINGILKWDSVGFAASYTLQLDQKSDFTGSGLVEENIFSNQFNYNGLQHNQQYYWRIRSVNGRHLSDWSEKCSFTTADVSFAGDKNGPELHIRINPNPPIDKLAITIDAPGDGRIIYEIFDFYGRKMSEPGEFNLLIGNNNLIVEIDTFASGIYFIRFSSAEWTGVLPFVKADE